MGLAVLKNKTPKGGATQFKSLPHPPPSGQLRVQGSVSRRYDIKMVSEKGCEG
jgi:hypothetical protein